MSRLTVQDFMTEDLVTVEPQESIEVAYDLMRDRQVRHLPVVDKSGNLKGIISDRDIIGKITTLTERALAAADEGKQRAREDLNSLRVSDIMTTTPDTVAEDDDIRDAGLALLENKISSLPVVRGVQLIGILTEADFVRYVVESTKND